MVYRILFADDDAPKNTTDAVVGEFSPREGQQYEVDQIYCHDETDLDYSLKIEERKLFDNVPAEELADKDNGLPWGLTVRGGEDLTVLATNSSGSAVTAEFSIVINDSNEDR